MSLTGWKTTGLLLGMALVGIGNTAWAETSAAEGATASQLMEHTPIHWVSVAQIEKSLEDEPPMNVGFDIDDTLMLSAPGFYRGSQVYGNRYTSNPEFWRQMNNGWDAFSVPKQVGRDLIAMHLHRHDHIYFVTARGKTDTETVSALLQKTFNIPANDMHPIIMAGSKRGENTKTPWLKALGITLYYGDADADIQAARDADARGIRVLRASNSTYVPHPLAGALGEEVIVDSDH